VHRCRALLAGLACVATVRTASADAPPKQPEDPRELFGFGKKPKAEPPPSCDDAHQLGCATATDPFDAVSPFALRTWLPARYLLRLPVADARHDAVAHYGVGASRDEAGPAFGGATGLENRWTIEGAPADSARTGNVETRVPLTFTAGLLVSAGGFAARDRTSTGGTIDVELLRGGTAHTVEAHAWGGTTGEPRARPIADSTYQLRRLTIAPGADASLSVVATGPLPRLAGGRTWYAAGVAPALATADVTWRAARLVDADGDDVPDGFPGPIALDPIAITSERPLDYLVPMMARTGWERGPHDVALTLIGHANRDHFFLANATEQAAGIARAGYVGDAIATWRGRWSATRARAQLAWHRSVQRQDAYDDAAQGQAQRLTAYVPAMLDDDPALAAACVDDDPADLYTPCPIPFGFFASGGAGLLVDSVADRPTATADVAHRHGRHVVRAGATLEDTRLVTTSRFTGGEQLRSLFEGHVDRTRFFDGECPEHEVGEPAPPCNYTTSQELAYRTRYSAAYVEDTFEPAPRIRVNGGVRWELMWVGPRLHFSDELAPRLGIAWDVLGDGRSRVWASMGRSFIMIPPGTGPTVIARNHTVRDVELGDARTRNVASGAAFSVADGIQPAAQDELTTGLELGLGKLARAVVWIQGRTLRRGLETVVVNPDTFTYAFDNPGRIGNEPARRDSRTIAAEVLLAPSPQLTVRASYSHTRTTGSWAGPFDPRQGANLYNGSDWNDGTANMLGRLPTDAGHRTLFELERRGSVRAVEIAVATRLTANSGRPRSVLADTDAGVVYVLPRGAAGRGPMITQANVRVAARWGGTELTLDVFNVFDRTEATLVDEFYAGESVRPIIGGRTDDLVFLKNADGSAPRRRSGYGLPTAFQAPIGASLGLHHAF